MIRQHKVEPDEKHWTNAEMTADIPALAEKNKKEKVLFRLLRKLLPRGTNVVEGGSGNGWIIAAMQTEGRNWTGVDYSKTLIEAFRKAYPQYARHAYSADIRKLPFKDNTFDAYFSPGVIEHYETQRKEMLAIIDEARRVVKPGGKILVSVPVINDARLLKIPLLKIREWKTRHLPFYQAIYTRNEIKTLLESFGLRVVALHGCGVHDTKLFGRKLFPAHMHQNRLLNRLFAHMVLAECVNEK